MSITEILYTLLWGFELEPGNALAGLIHGGGMWSMVKTCFILLVSCSLTGVLQGAGVLDGLEKLLLKPCGRLSLYLKTLMIAVLGICCGCNQSISIVIAGQLLKHPYEHCGLDKYELAKDISFTAIPLAAVIPWSVASMVPTTTLGIEAARHLPYLFYPLLVPLCYGVIYALQEFRGKNIKNKQSAAK